MSLQSFLLLPPLPMAHFRLRARMMRPWQLPEYAGSQLRGIFGHALRAVTCRCPEDKHASDCLFATCFVSPRRHQGESIFPYVIVPPLDGERSLIAGDTFNLEFVVTGETAWRAAEYMVTWSHALEEWLGDKSSHAVLDKVEVLLPEAGLPLSLAAVPGRQFSEPVWRVPSDIFHGSGVILHFVTPLRIHREGMPLEAGDLTARTLCLSLLRRLQGVFGDGWLSEEQVTRLLSALASLSVSDNRLTWREFTRYSNRQQREVKLGGLTGTVRLEGNLTEWLPLWVLGQVVHLGKNTTLGFGHYRILQSAAS